MKKNQKFITLIMSTALVFTTIFASPISTSEVQAASITKQQAINKYYNFQESYNKHEVPLIKAFNQQYDGSLAHQVVRRAIWYMEHGYTVYNTANYSLTGQLDCSNYTKLVYGDFGINITSVSRNYNQVGTKVAGVSSTRVGTSSSGQALYGIKGIENLRPGDILTYWAGTESNKYISHVSIYMGVINGKPAVINTVSNRPTALGIVNNFNYWFGEKFLEARRVLPADAWSPTAAKKYKDSGPVIPTNYYLPPQKRIVMPTNTVVTSNTTSTNSTNILVSKVTGNVVNVRSTASATSSILGTVRNGDEVVVKRQLNGWYEIDWNGRSGYIASFLLSSPIARTGTATTSLATVSGGVVNLRSGPGTNYSILTVVRKGDKVEVLGQSNNWTNVKFGNTTGYLASSLLSF